MNKNLIQVVNNELTTTSLLVAEKFHKNHAHVLRDIDSLINRMSEDNPISDSPKLFVRSEYSTSQNKSVPMYVMNRDGFALLAMGFTGKEALTWKLEYIKAFNKMEKLIHSGAPTITDNRLEIAKLLVKAPRASIKAIKELYPEYFTPETETSVLECVSDVNTSYTKWIEDYNITAEWIGEFPTTDVYNNYMRYCTKNRLSGMGKKTFYATLELDFGLYRKQKTDKYRYFIRL